MQKLILTYCFILLVLLSCDQSDEYDKSKRNQDWAWFENSDTGENSWIPVKNESTVQNGYYKLFYFNGNVYETGRVAQGKHVDTSFFYDRGGKIYGYKVSGREQDGVFFYRNGFYRVFYSDGKIKSEGTIKNNRIGNKWTTYYRNGKVSEAIDMQNGIGLVKRFYENGNPQSKLYRDLSAKEDKTLNEWYEDGNLYFSGSLKDGKYQGIQKRFFENGNIQKEWEMHEDVENGFLKVYLENATLVESQNFVKGQIDGKAEKWYASGKIKAVADFKEGKANGAQKFFYENGHPQAIIHMKTGVPHGENLQFDSTGKLIKQLLFENGKIINR